MKQKEKRLKINEQSIRQLWRYFKWLYICVIVDSKGEKRGREQEKILENIMAEKGLNLMETINT